jgi:adenosylcobinamide-GDP ribazoletransferase
VDSVNGLRRFLLALQFFTRVPVTGALARWVGFSPAMLNASVAHFPGVGWLVGAVAAAVFCIAQARLAGLAGVLAAAALSTIATVLMTGAFHEDGLADVADGLGGSADRARALEIMKDSRLGTFGVVALMLALGLKVLLLALLAGPGQGTRIIAALVSAHVLSRLAPLFLIRFLAYVGGEGAASKSKPLADAISGGALAVGILWALPAVAWLVITYGAARGLAPLALGALAALWMARLLHRRLGGFTGDGLGATQQVCELAMYLALAWRA